MSDFEKVEIQSPNAVIIKTDGEIIPITFVCIGCNRRSVFANKFAPSVLPGSDMECPECRGRYFKVQK